MIHLLAAIAAAIGLLGPAGTVSIDRAATTLATRAPSPHAAAVAAYDAMTPRQRLGQLLMTALPSTGPARHELADLKRHAVGSVILTGNSSAGRAAIARITHRIHRHLAVAGVPPIVSTDQEGGEVQRLRGRGFATMPSALQQGAMTSHALRVTSAMWARQLAAGGIDVDLAPVADVVPSRGATDNQPIGRYDREYGHHPKPVARHVVAFARGMHAGSVAVTVKHFPGLGRASGNTDFRRGVTDPTTRHDPYLRPFRAAVDAGAAYVMVSSAAYPHIDGHRPACFSHTIVTGMLRHDLGFTGPIVSDDLGTVALSAVPAGTRAVRFFRAGGTIALDTTPAQVPAMIRALRDARSADAGFARTLRRAAITDLTAKERATWPSAS